MRTPAGWLWSLTTGLCGLVPARREINKKSENGAPSAAAPCHDAPVPSIGFLHTSPVHQPTFTARTDATAAPRLVTQVHRVDESLLDDARSQGIDEGLRARIRLHLALLADDVDVVVCTCSTISGEAERLAGIDGITLVRVDRPMADLAVASGRRIGIAAAVASTVGPTRALLDDVARISGSTVELIEIDCASAWTFFETGDMSAYHSAIAVSVRAAAKASDLDVVVLAQASMDGAVGLLGGEAYRVLSSPQPAVDRAVALAFARY